MPKTNSNITTSVISRAKSMQASGATQAEIADALGISTTSVNNILNSSRTV